MYRKILQNPYWLFSPFLACYSVFIVCNKWPVLYGDEIRYVDFAHNLLHGFYSPPVPKIDLWNGPGYPLILAPLLALHIPVLYITLLNGVFLYLAVVLIYKALFLVTVRRNALLFSVLLGIYPNAFAVLPILYTEALSYLLVALVVYMVALYQIKGKPRHLIMAGIALGYLTLTKIIFGYVITAGILLYAAIIISGKSRRDAVRSMKVLVIAFVFAMPYLFYTWHLTGKIFYWGDSGGMSLYWMSSPYSDEYGDWKAPDLSNKQYPELFKSSETEAILKKNHARELNFIEKHDPLQQDELFKKAALRNIEAHPFDFIKNYYYNISRMLFNFPYSYSYQNGAIVRNILTGSMILWATVAGIIISVINRRSLIFPVQFILMITAVYIAASGALSAYPRQLDIMLPALLFWFGFLKFNINKINVRFPEIAPAENLNLAELSAAESDATDAV